MDEARNEALEKRIREKAELRDEIYDAMPKKEFSREKLAECLKRYYEKLAENTEAGSLKKRFQTIAGENHGERLVMLQKGLERGKKSYNERYEKYKTLYDNGEDLDLQEMMREEIGEKIKDLDESGKRVALYCIIEGLCADALESDEKKQNFQFYTSCKTTEKLMDEASEVLAYTCRAQADMCIGMTGGAEQTEDLYKEWGFSDEERELIDTAAAYAIERKAIAESMPEKALERMENNEIINAEIFGEEYAVQKTGIAAIKENALLGTFIVGFTLAMSLGTIVTSIIVDGMIAMGATWWAAILVGVVGVYPLVATAGVFLIMLACEGILKLCALARGESYGKFLTWLTGDEDEPMNQSMNDLMACKQRMIGEAAGNGEVYEEYDEEEYDEEEYDEEEDYEDDVQEDGPTVLE